MVLEYLPTHVGHFVRVNVSKYSSTMEHLGVAKPMANSHNSHKPIIIRCGSQVEIGDLRSDSQVLCRPVKTNLPAVAREG